MSEGTDKITDAGNQIDEVTESAEVKDVETPVEEQIDDAVSETGGLDDAELARREGQSYKDKYHALLEKTAVEKPAVETPAAPTVDPIERELAPLINTLSAQIRSGDMTQEAANALYANAYNDKKALHEVREQLKEISSGLGVIHGTSNMDIIKKVMASQEIKPGSAEERDVMSQLKKEWGVENPNALAGHTPGEIEYMARSMSLIAKDNAQRRSGARKQAPRTEGSGPLPDVHTPGKKYSSLQEVTRAAMEGHIPL